MAITARFLQPIQIVVTPEMAAACKAIADAEGVSRASVYRHAIEVGLAGAWMTARLQEAEANA